MGGINEALMQKKRTSLIIVLTAAALVVGALCVYFVAQLRKTTYAETERYLAELSDCMADSVVVQMKENLLELESLCTSYSVAVENEDDPMDFLQRKARQLDFVRVSVVSRDGSSVGSDGMNFDFGSYRDDIMKAFEGKTIIRNGIAEYAGTDNCFIYAAPVYENGTVVKVLVTCNTSTWLDEFTKQDYFDGDAIFHIFEQNGNFVTRSDNQNNVLNGNNIYTALEGMKINSNKSVSALKENVKNNKSGYIYFTTPDKQERLMFYRPITGYDHSGVDNFYISMVVVKDTATKQFDTLLGVAIAIDVFIALMFMTLIITLFFIYSKSNRMLCDIAFVDQVTGGSNRMRFELEAKEILSKAEPNEYMFVTMNVAKFKLINDAFGNEAGNRVLRHIYDVIKKHICDGELLCRTESDNFDLLIKYCSNEDVQENLSRIAADINSFNTKNRYYISVTVGVYNIDQPGLSVIGMRDRANIARKNKDIAFGNHLYTCMFYSELEQRRQRREKEMENKMEAALANEDFVVYLQPKVITDDRSISGAEALVRWMDKDEGLVPPNDFIPFFEKNGFIIKLDLYVFEKVCQYIRKWIDCGLKPVPISVNLSRLHLTNPDFINGYRDIRKKYDVPAELIEIELTETLVFENLEQIIHTVTEIHKSGFRCSLDDFGSGYSSLNMLKDIKVDTLKLDREFFRSPNSDNPRERAIIQSVVDMAKKLNMTTVSEGVETFYQLEFLKSIECDMAQGFVISKPVPIDEFEKIAFGKVIEKK